jgi:lysophospholipase L1-like esterase
MNHAPLPSPLAIALAFALAACAAVVQADVPPAAAPPAAIGVNEDPCRGVPVAPTAAHQASADPYASWMHDWLGLDWSQRCRYQRENAALPAATPARVVFLGDSITEGWKLTDPGFFSGERLDRGISGQTTEQMLVRFRADVIELHPAVVHIMAGTNDIAGNTGATSLALIQGNIASMTELARAHGERVILASIPPASRFIWQPLLRPAAAVIAMNEWLRAYAAREQLIYVDYYAVLNDGQGGMKAEYSSDGTHPNAAGYAAMRPLAEAALRRTLAAGRNAP